MKECPRCQGRGQIGDFEIPIWGNTGDVSIAFRSIAGEDATSKTNDRAKQEGIEFAKFIKDKGHGCFHDGLKEELDL